ncbi:YehR family lipoprotein [Listeria marthii]|uniref:YehR family lipoprotein n=1 Tax=Listeria marthii TaxID=529731 RepID=UPI00162AAFE8|nr:YehR family lipoprotein [Listeria marthii]MBC2039005.1 YehR family lipoprotein [Listeria marthii]
MKMLKKGTMALFVMVMAVMLVACGGKEETKTYELSQNGSTTKMTYTYVKDKVTIQTTENEMTYSALGFKNKEEAEKALKESSDKFQGVEGVKESIEYKDDKAIETLEIDYEKADAKELTKLPGFAASGDIEKGISMEESAKMLESQGFKEAK